MSNDFRWLIEAPGPKYLAVQRLTASAEFEWTADHNKALAFRSEKQADDMMTALRQMDRLHDSYENNGKLSWGKLFAFEPTLGNAKAVEHAWMDRDASADQFGKRVGEMLQGAARRINDAR